MLTTDHGGNRSASRGTRASATTAILDVVPDTASRMLHLLALLQARRHCTGPKLATQLGVSARTIRADVDRLRSLGYDIDATSGTGGGYRLRPGAVLPPVTFSDDEALTVAVALRTASTCGLADEHDSTATAAVKLDQLLPSRLRQELDTLAAVAETGGARGDLAAPATFTAVARACRAQEQLRFTYRDRHQQPSERRVEPHRLVHVGGRWYLAAYDLARDAWRSFRLDRIHPRVPTGPRFELRSPPESSWEGFVTRGRMAALWIYRTRLVVHADARTVAARIPIGSWSVEPRTTDTSWLHAGAHSPTLLAVYLGALDLDFTIDRKRAPELHEAILKLAARYNDAVTENLVDDD